MSEDTIDYDSEPDQTVTFLVALHDKWVFPNTPGCEGFFILECENLEDCRSQIDKIWPYININNDGHKAQIWERTSTVWLKSDPVRSTEIVNYRGSYLIGSQTIKKELDENVRSHKELENTSKESQDDLNTLARNLKSKAKELSRYSNDQLRNPPVDLNNPGKNGWKLGVFAVQRRVDEVFTDLLHLAHKSVTPESSDSDSSDSSSDSTSEVLSEAPSGKSIEYSRDIDRVWEEIYSKDPIFMSQAKMNSLYIGDRGEGSLVPNVDSLFDSKGNPYRYHVESATWPPELVELSLYLDPTEFLTVDHVDIGSKYTKKVPGYFTGSLYVVYDSKNQEWSPVAPTHWEASQKTQLLVCSPPLGSGWKMLAKGFERKDTLPRRDDGLLELWFGHMERSTIGKRSLSSIRDFLMSGEYRDQSHEVTHWRRHPKSRLNKAADRLAERVRKDEGPGTDGHGGN